MKPELTPEFLAQYVELRENILYWKTRDSNIGGFNTRFAGKPVGSVNGDGYLCFRLNVQGNRWELKNHVVIFALVNGYYPKHFVDHKDNNRLNNAPENLRKTDSYGNTQNRKAGANNRLGLKNIEKISDTTYRVRITSRGEVYRSPTMSLEEALVLRDIKLKELHGEFANNGGTDGNNL